MPSTAKHLRYNRSLHKGAKFNKKVDRVMFSVLIILSHNALYLYQVSQKYIDWFCSYKADMISILLIAKGHTSLNCTWVTVLVLCTLSNHYLNLYQVKRKYLERLRSMERKTISIPIITKGHDFVKYVRGVKILILFFFERSLAKKVLNNFTVMDWTGFRYLLLQRGDIPLNLYVKF